MNKAEISKEMNNISIFLGVTGIILGLIAYPHIFTSSSSAPQELIKVDNPILNRDAYHGSSEFTLRDFVAALRFIEFPGKDVSDSYGVADRFLKARSEFLTKEKQ